MFQIEAEDFIGYPSVDELHALRNTGSPHMVHIIVGQWLGFNVVTYPEQTERICRHAGLLPDLVNIAAVSHSPAPIL